MPTPARTWNQTVTRLTVSPTTSEKNQNCETRAMLKCYAHLLVSSKDIQKARRTAKRNRTSVACKRCKKAKIKCSDYRPCRQCTNTEYASGCEIGIRRTEKPILFPADANRSALCSNNEQSMFPRSQGSPLKVANVLHRPNFHSEVPSATPPLRTPWSPVSASPSMQCSTMITATTPSIQHPSSFATCDAYKPTLPPLAPHIVPIPCFLPPAVAALISSTGSAPYPPPPPPYALSLLLALAAAAPTSPTCPPPFPRARNQS
jgi:hypothetical protein